jgi:hypothetical protein
VLQKCYKSVTRVLQECYRSVTGVLQQCYTSVTGYKPGKPRSAGAKGLFSSFSRVAGSRVQRSVKIVLFRGETWACVRRVNMIERKGRVRPPRILVFDMERSSTLMLM